MKSLAAACLSLLGLMTAAQAEQPTLSGPLISQVNTTKGALFDRRDRPRQGHPAEQHGVYL